MRTLASTPLLALFLVGCVSAEPRPAYEVAHQSLRKGMSRAEAEAIMMPHAEGTTSTMNSSWGMPPDTVEFFLPNNKRTRIGLSDLSAGKIVRIGPIKDRDPRDDAAHAVAERDYRLVGYPGYALTIPGTPAGFDHRSYAPGIRVLPHIDCTSPRKELRKARAYALRYNRAVLAATREAPGACAHIMEGDPAS